MGQVSCFLGIEVTRTTEGGIHLSHSKYVKDILTKDNMQSTKGVGSTMTPGQKLHDSGSNLLSNPTHYRSTVGALQYLIVTRPELAFSVNKVC